MALLVASIGNSRVALGLFAHPSAGGGRQPTLAASCPVPREGVFAPDFRSEEPVSAAVVASVNPPCDAAVCAWISRTFRVKPLEAPRDLPLPIANRYRPPEAAGADRVVNALAAWDEFAAACIVVDAGTAVTVDAVSGDGAFLGGAILPGIALAARALKQGTALLPEVAERTADRAIGDNTRSAIASGILRGLAGAVDRLVEDAGRELGGCQHLVLTGGDADLLAKLCRTQFEVRPHLTLAGLACAYFRRASTLGA